MSGSENKPKTVINTVPNKIEFCKFVPGDVVRVKSDSKGPNYVIEGMDWNCSMREWKIFVNGIKAPFSEAQLERVGNDFT